MEHLIAQLRDGTLPPSDAGFIEDDRLRARVSPWADGVAKTVDLDIGTAEIHRSGLVFPLSWKAVGSGGLLPALDGELRLANRGRDETLLVFQGTYQPPLGPLGKAVDRVALGRLAEATVRNYVAALSKAVAEVKSPG